MRIIVRGGSWKSATSKLQEARLEHALRTFARGTDDIARILSLYDIPPARKRELVEKVFKKVGWNTNEEEKLLHLIKLMPGQWNVIAPIVGRTVHECQVHYELLLKEANDKYKPGEPEEPAEEEYFRVARGGLLDPGLTAEEQEMLDLARARLKNVQVVRQKRKAREVQLEAALRNEALQSRKLIRRANTTSRKFILPEPHPSYPPPCSPQDPSLLDEAEYITLAATSYKSVDGDGPQQLTPSNVPLTEAQQLVNDELVVNSSVAPEDLIMARDLVEKELRGDS